ncbi:hypothetical protein YC2023_049690 [Brassica napus]
MYQIRPKTKPVKFWFFFYIRFLNLRKKGKAEDRWMTDLSCFVNLDTVSKFEEDKERIYMRYEQQSKPTPL